MIKDPDLAIEKFDSVALMEQMRDNKVYTFKAMGNIIKVKCKINKTKDIEKDVNKILSSMHLAN